MKCPKCSYIGFEHTDRCRNCGYDFALAPAASKETDLPLRTQEAGPLGDFDLGAGARGAHGEGGTSGRRYNPDFDPRITPPARASVPDLPLFGDGPDDLPIPALSASAPPLAVRRATPPAAKARPRPTPRVVDPPLAPLPLVPDSRADVPPPTRVAAAREATTSPLGARILASLIDTLLLLGADLVVIYFTLQICRLAPSQVLLLPLPPLLAFLVLFNGGYLVLLTAAGGQTLGKMAAGVKVVGADDGPVTVSRALLRATLLLASAVPVGLGLLPVLLSADRRGLHDRLADTRVVPAATDSRT
jgi:uncharacterized RDD family membrane protein YckC